MWPEVIPMWNIKADTIAQELAHLFSLVVLPKQIVTDQRTTFMSKVLKVMWHLVGIQSLRTSV